MNPDNSKDYSSIFLKDPLYNYYSIKDFTNDDILNILFFDPETNGYDKLNAFDSYCPICKKDTSFVSKSTDKQMLIDT